MWEYDPQVSRRLPVFAAVVAENEIVCCYNMLELSRCVCWILKTITQTTDPSHIMYYRCASLMLEWLCHREIGEATTDCSYRAPLWDKTSFLNSLTAKSGLPVQQLVDALCNPKIDPHGLMQSIILPQYIHRSAHKPSKCLGCVFHRQFCLFEHQQSPSTLCPLNARRSNSA